MKKIYSTALVILCIVSLSLNAQTISLEAFGTTFNYPTNIANAGDSRMFVLEQDGFIWIIKSDGTTPPTPFLDIDALVYDNYQVEWERGLLSMVFHPNYSSNGYFYVNYIDQVGNNIISRFSVSANPDIADVNSELVIMNIPHPYDAHHGGDMAFGSDGYLYISKGDGGTDQGDPENRSQNLAEIHGKILRIDVDNPTNGNTYGNNYSIPAGNPFVETPTDDPNTLAEIWLYGFRNPAKFSFDSANGDLWIGDVGQEDIEEINLNAGNVPGLNYGWRCYEGSSEFNMSGGCPPIGNLEFAAHEYNHFESDGKFRCSVAGGYRYRGSAYPNLIGTYFAGDWCSGEIFMITPDGSGGWNRTNHPTTFSSRRWVAFAEDNNGELFVVSNPLSNNGQVYKIKANTMSTTSTNLNYKFSIIPNPTEDNIVTLNFNKATSLKEVNAINLQGQKIGATIETINSTTAKIEFANISSGIYVIETITNKGEKSQNKLIIK